MNQNIIVVISYFLMAYVALAITVYLHELGHRGKTTMKWLPIPHGYTVKAKSTIGGVVMNFLVFTAIMVFSLYSLGFKLTAWNYLSGENFMVDFIMMVGVFSWLHFCSYLILDPIGLHPGSLFLKGKGDIASRFSDPTLPVLVGLLLFFVFGALFYFNVSFAMLSFIFEILSHFSFEW